MGYPSFEAERKIFSRKSADDPVQDVATVVTPEEITRIFNAVDNVHMDPSILEYIMNLVYRTRNSDVSALGVGPRGGMALHRAARALALIRGRDYCLADDVKTLAEPVLAHRIIPSDDGFSLIGTKKAAQRIIRDILSDLEIPT
jgi:MoxR-like ATPase